MAQNKTQNTNRFALAAQPRSQRLAKRFSRRTVIARNRLTSARTFSCAPRPSTTPPPRTHVAHTQHTKKKKKKKKKSDFGEARGLLVCVQNGARRARTKRLPFGFFYCCCAQATVAAKIPRTPSHAFNSAHERFCFMSIKHTTHNTVPDKILKERIKRSAQ